MKAFHVALAIFVAIIWGAAFVVSKIGLETFTPPQLTALRFVVAALCVFFLPRPKVTLGALIAVGLTVFAGQFLLQFFGIASGMPAGLTAIVVQTQALFTVAFAALLIGDKPNGQQVAGMLTAFVGLAIIGTTLDTNVPVLAFVLVLTSAISWAIGNVFVKRMHDVNMLHLMVWASLVPPLPAFVLSYAMGGPASLLPSIAEASWPAILAPVYLGLLATVFAYAVWGHLLQQYSTGLVAPFALLAPAVGAVMSSLVFGETFGPLRLTGVAGIIAGVAIVVLPRRNLLAVLKRVGFS